MTFSVEKTFSTLTGILTQYQNSRSIPERPISLGNLFSMRLGDRLESTSGLFSRVGDRVTPQVDPIKFLEQDKVLLADLSTRRNDEFYAVFTKAHMEEFINDRRYMQEDHGVGWYLISKDRFETHEPPCR